MTAPDALPHGYPFRLVERVLRGPKPEVFEGVVETRVSANGRAAMGEGWFSPVLLAEAVAQAALLLEGGDPDVSRRGLLAGLDGFELQRSPRAGETLRIEVRLAGRFGSVAKFDGRVTCGGESIARGSVLVRQGTPEPSEAV